jgi:pimeloyl-ACP methyl ester carboxylesterase
MKTIFPALVMLLATLSWPLPSPAAGMATIDLTLTGRPVKADLYQPANPPAGMVVLAHGFLRSRHNMAGHAAALAAEGYAVVVPDLPYLTDSRDNGRALTELVAQIRSGAFAPAIERVVLIGFSAGGLSTLLAAASPGVAGYVGLDAIDRPGGVGLAAARQLQTPTILIRRPASFCNGYGIAEPWHDALPKLVEQKIIEGASHCDFEAPTDGWCEAFCGSTDAARQQAIREAIVAAVKRLLPRNQDITSPFKGEDGRGLGVTSDPSPPKPSP